MRLGQLKQLHSSMHQTLQKQKGLLLGWGWPPTCGGSRPAGNKEIIFAKQLEGGRSWRALIWGASLSPQHLSRTQLPEWASPRRAFSTGWLMRAAPGFLRSRGGRLKPGWSGVSMALTPPPPRSRPNHTVLEGESL